MTSTISSDFFLTKETICNFQVPNEPAQVEDQRSFGAGGDICFFRFFLPPSCHVMLVERTIAKIGV